MYDRILTALERFPDWFKAILLSGCIVLLVLFLQQKSDAQAEQIVKLREIVAADGARIGALKEEVDGLSDHMLRIEGKLDIIIIQLQK